MKDMELRKEVEQKPSLFNLTFWDDILPRCFKRDVFSGSFDEDGDKRAVAPETRYICSESFHS